MARVELSCVVLNLASDLADVCFLPQWSEFAQTTALPVTYQTMASGRVVQTVRRGRARTWKLDIDFCPPETLAWLDSRAGRLMWVRTPNGRKMCGSFPSFDDAHIKAAGDLSTVALVFTQVTVFEAV